MVEHRVKYKCLHCGKYVNDHNATDYACPLGKKHRSLGYMSYSNINKFDPDILKPIPVNQIFIL